MFKDFVKSLKRTGNESLVEAILKGYCSLYTCSENNRNHALRPDLHSSVPEHKKSNKPYTAPIDVYSTGLVESSRFKTLQKNKIPLTDKERKEVFKKDAVWHYDVSIDPNTGRKVKKVSAIWKSKNPKTGEVIYGTNTHRAFQTRKSLKAAINIFHNFIKGTS